MRGDGNVFKRGRIYWISYYVNGKQQRESSGSEKISEARNLLRERRRDISANRFVGLENEKRLVKETIDSYINNLKKQP